MIVTQFATFVIWFFLVPYFHAIPDLALKVGAVPDPGIQVCLTLPFSQIGAKATSFEMVKHTNKQSSYQP